MKLSRCSFRCLVVLLPMTLGLAACAAPDRHVPSPDPRFTVGPLLYQDDFAGPGVWNWTPELEAGGSVTEDRGRMEIDVPRGATIWFRPALAGPVLIEYQATVIGQGGLNDRVSDLNCFWMAQDPSRPDRLLAAPRSGKFSDYDTLAAYYVGQGGNGNTTTRFRRYIGAAGNRPLRPQDDLRASEYLLRPNVTQTIRLVACGPLIQYYCGDRRLFEMQDSAPYTHGWFGIRTTENHLRVQHFRVYRLLPTGHAGKVTPLVSLHSIPTVQTPRRFP